ncbi:hypothetical protein Ciccas_008334 [Cichlidogyrus casuarinus]|uniref:Uncharacterized protein n=1 Tax=Cichlidogyrus casuarinus TaxID=1844966 RepID=A0ABD2Q4G7_9PLAT
MEVMDIRLATQKRRVKPCESWESYRVLFEDRNHWPRYQAPSKTEIQENSFGFAYAAKSKPIDWRAHRRREFSLIFGRPNVDACGNMTVPYVRDSAEETGRPQDQLRLRKDATESSLYRDSFSSKSMPPPSVTTRHCSNPMQVSKGIIPVLENGDQTKKVWQEGISFEALYDSRKMENYPKRGNRHGAFIWHRADPFKSQLVNESLQSLSRVVDTNIQQDPVMITAPKALKRQNRKEPSVVGDIIFGT